ncbi:MAG: NADH-quinone oxidoreductase subunit L [Candidatus Verstraetearchaeota archaeon]|nr:NADH-quinone oxidoreductase subunit L [Candidatus Verstraetearchaeota archaeon]
MELSPIWLSIILPAAIGLTSYVAGRRAGYFVTASSAFSFLIIISLIEMFINGGSLHIEGFAWWPIPVSPLNFGLIIDPLSVLMGSIVSFISLIVFLYSIGYMKQEEGAPRFWFFMGCFESSMLLLVFSDNLVMTFLGWEGVGLCSYFLIGHYYRDQREKWLGGPDGVAPYVRPSLCGEKALLTTGFADSIMLIGIMLLYSIYGTFNFHELQLMASSSSVDSGLILAASVCLIMGPLGKSAQFPFHEWLPEAMSGPTPVSALLHSATMVKAGVYLVARVSPLFYILSGMYPGSMNFFLIASVAGLLTAIIGSIYGTIAYEMKKVLAYSTISQLGFMFVALGISGISGDPLLGLSAGIFHLLAHSIFKAALFLGAGSAIHASHTIYITEMGQLRKACPKTFLAMTVSALSLCALPPLMGFWSKDAILAAVYPVNFAAAALLAASSALTCFYSIRLIWYTFLAPSKKKIHSHEEWLLVGPALFLSGITLFLGLFGKSIEHTVSESLSHALELTMAHETDAYVAIGMSMAALSLGFASAYLKYFRKPCSSEKANPYALTGLRRVLTDRPVDKSYSLLSASLKRFSRAVYDFEILLNKFNLAVASSVMTIARNLSSIHSGDLNRYLGIAAVLMLLLLVIMLLVGSA